MPWIAEIGRAKSDASTRIWMNQTSGRNVHSANATIATPTVRAVTRVRARTDGEPKSVRVPSTVKLSATAGHGCTKRYSTAGAAHSSQGTTYGFGIPSPLTPRYGEVTTCGVVSSVSGPTSIGVQRKRTAIRCHRSSGTPSGKVANTIRNADVAVASAVSPSALKSGNHGCASTSRFVCTNVSYAEPTSIAVDARATSRAVRDDETVSSHMPNTNSGSAPSSGHASW